MQTTGYSTGMQSWLATNAIDTPQNDCIVPLAPAILSPTSGTTLTTGTVTILWTGEVWAVINVSISGGITLTWLINGSWDRSITFLNISNGSYLIFASQTDAWNNVSVSITSTFSIAIPIPPTPTPTPTPSGWGGGWGAHLQQDNCPYGDNSPSYYDKDCGKVSIENIPEIKDPLTFMGQCQYKDWAFELYKTTMTDIKGMPYEQAVITMLSKCLIHWEANKGISYKWEEFLRYWALYKVAYRLVGKAIDIPATQKHWSDIYYTEWKRLWLREGLSVPKDPNTLVWSRALQKVIHNILDYGSLSNPALEANLKSKTYNSLLVKRWTFALVIEKLIHSQE